MKQESELDRNWYVVRSKPRREEFAQRQLIRRGVETFLPRIVESVRPGCEPSVSPLFPGYLFARVELATQYSSVIWTPGVTTMVAFGDTPVAVEENVVDFLKERCAGRGLIIAQPTFDSGDQVKIVRGPLAGLQGIVQGRVNGRDRVLVLMEVLRRQTEVAVPAAALESVSL